MTWQGLKRDRRPATDEPVPPSEGPELASTGASDDDRDRLLWQLQEINEQLVLTALRAQESAAAADMARCEVEAREAREKARRLVDAEPTASAGALPLGVAHEINNPLASVTLGLDLVLEQVLTLGDGSPAGPLREIADGIRRAQEGTARVGTIVRGLKTPSPGEQERGAVADPPRATRTPGRAVVLVVDDESAVGMLVGRALREHDVTVVTNVKDAVALLDAGREFDVILSDLMMPVASGMDLYEELARCFPTAVDRVVFISGGAATPNTQAFLDRVPNERIEKPFRVDDLRALVARRVR